MALSFEQIESQAASLLRKAGALGTPVDLYKVAKHLEVQVHQQPFEDVVSGLLVITGAERHIMVNKAHHPNRQRFSIAHELGHLVLHHEQGDRLFIDNQMSMYQRAGAANSIAYKRPDSSTTPTEETEANQFASALLMPSELLLYATKDRDVWDEFDVSRLAVEFTVSEQAMSIRLQQLGVLGPTLFAGGAAQQPGLFASN
jgi:predicted transcriptional regulator